MKNHSRIWKTFHQEDRKKQIKKIIKKKSPQNTKCARWWKKWSRWRRCVGYRAACQQLRAWKQWQVTLWINTSYWNLIPVGMKQIFGLTSIVFLSIKSCCWIKSRWCIRTECLYCIKLMMNTKSETKYRIQYILYSISLPFTDSVNIFVLNNVSPHFQQGTIHQEIVVS